MGDVYSNPPQSRNEAILNSIVEGTEYTDPPQSRIEDLLLEVKEVIEEGGHDESATRASIAPTESDAAHASKRIEIGEQFYLSDDKLYTATAVIAQGSAIVTSGVGQNVEVSDSVTGQINSLDGRVDELEDDVDDLYANIGILTTPVPAIIANALPVLKRDITSAFYGSTLRSEIAEGNFKNVRAGDYIIGQSTGSIYYVACCDWMFNKGDQTNATYQAQAYGQHHLGLMLFKPVGTTSLWLGKGDAGGSWQVSANDKGRCPWNAATSVDPTSTSAVGSNDTNITRSYNGSNVSGYMGSFIRERMDAILLPQCFQADFGSSNVLKFRNLNGNAVTTDKPSGGQGNWNGCTTGWTWYDRYLDLPSEVEVYGSRVFGSAYDIGVQCERLPMFKNADINAFYPRLDFWTKAVASSSRAAYRGNDGNAGNYGASGALWACPLACVR